MNSLLNRIFLLILSCCFLLMIPFDTSFIFLLFIAIAISCLNYFFESTFFLIGSTLLFAVIACFFPYAFCFFPLMTYDILSTKPFITCLPYILALILHRDIWTVAHGAFLFIGIIGAILLYRLAKQYELLEEQFKKSRDDSMELQSLLQEKNRSLIQKQNAEIYAATLKERNRIAREIHDNVGHLLSRSILMTGALKATNKDTTLTPGIQVIEETLTSAMDTIRDSVHDLHDRSVDLQENLQTLVSNFDYFTISLDYDIQSEIPADIKYTYITIIKEGLSNIIKHSNATKVSLLVREHPSLYQLILQDNGTHMSKRSSSGIGLVNIKERVDALQGNLQITTDSGFRIFITIPKQEVN